MVAAFTHIPQRALIGGDGPLLHEAIGWHPLIGAAVLGLPGGRQTFWGIPFDLAPIDADRRWLWLTREDGPRTIQLAADRVDHFVFAHFCGASRAAGETDPSGFVSRPGTAVAQYIIVYADGSESPAPIRRRYEINDVIIRWGQQAFGSRPHGSMEPRSWRTPHVDGNWGLDQTGIGPPPYLAILPSTTTNAPNGNYWLYALPNPDPDRPLAGVRVAAVGDEVVALGALTLVSGKGDPLRQMPGMTLVTPVGTLPSVDLGQVVRVMPLQASPATDWESARVRGWGDRSGAVASSQLVEIVAAEAATISVPGAQIAAREVSSSGGPIGTSGVTIEPAVDQLWSVEIRDADTGELLPARVHFRTPSGRYMPPAGHRTDVNDRWFEDYGADLKLGQMAYAYVPGAFRIRLPTGEILAEVAKGFEYDAVRLRLRPDLDRPDPLVIRLRRRHDWRGAGWVSADTHVHFLSPETAWLEARAEGVHVVNLLASQWGDLFTNVGDYTGTLSAVSRDDTLVRVGTENRQHLLGHLSLLGARGALPAAMGAAGPAESDFGDPTWSSLAAWADDARADGGLAIVPHFPNPLCEVVADVALGRLDALEIRDFWTGSDTLATAEWYRLLNLGFRVPIVGGTDKMSAGMPLGGVRTYARVPAGAVTWDGWTEAVRAGRTQSTSGPFIDLVVDGHGIGDAIRVGPNGAALEVVAIASSTVPINRLEIVQDGRVIADTDSKGPANRLEVHTIARVLDRGWIAARCTSASTAWHEWPVRFAAHTSPVYLDGPASAPRPEDLAYLRTILEGGIVWLDRLATRADPTTHDGIRRVFTDAIEALPKPVGSRPAG